MRHRLALVAAFAIAVSALGSGSAQAATVKDSFDYHVGDALLQSLGFPVGDKAMAENGDVVTVIGTGSFDVTTKTASGGGTFVHRTSGGALVASGTWTATGLIAFQSYGNGVPQGLPATFFGGRAALAIVGTPTGTALQLPATLEIECELGSPPAGTTEGIRLNVHDIINFDTTVAKSGATVFIRH
jgi:hypothetical protein